MKQYVEKIPSPPTKAMRRGIDIHKALENVYKDPRIIEAKTEDDFLEVIESVASEIKDDDKGDKWKKHFAAFNVSLLDNTGTCIPKITEGYVKDQQLGLNGIVDRVDSCDTGWVIIDYKTGNTKKVFDERNLLELSLYSLLTMRKHGGEVAYMGIYYVDSGKLVVEECKKEYIENALGRMEAAKIGIQQGNYPKKPSWMCRFCAYAKTVHCEYG